MIGTHKNGNGNGATMEKIDTYTGPQTGLQIPRPPAGVKLEERCSFSGPGDEQAQPCRGAWQPWTAYNLNASRPNGLQDVCRNCSALRRRNHRKRALGLIGGSSIERAVQAEEGRKMAEAEVVIAPIVVETEFKEAPGPELEVVDLSQGPTLDELKRVGAYLLTIKIGQDELLRIVESASQVSVENDMLKLEVTKLEGLLVEAKRSEETALGLAQTYEVELADERSAHLECCEALKLQVEYQKMLRAVGMNIPEQYRLGGE